MRNGSEREALAAAEAALSNAIRRQEEIEASYQRAISEVVHDIKNPLTAIMGYISMLNNQIAGPIDNEKYEDWINTIDTSANRLHALCESLLLEYGPKQEEPTSSKPEKRVNAKALVGEVREMFAAQAEERGIRLDCQIHDRFPDLAADPQAMFRAVTNLVSNAVKFTPHGGKINIHAEMEPDDDTFIMVVRDSGVGMSQDQIRKALDTNHSTISPHGDVGTGQGLGVVSRIVRELGGKLEIFSSENRGTRMKICLPRDVSLPPSQMMVV